jgi:mannose/fructose/N-acetylgalactosamine-specific phosphotransferase system component IIC
MVVMLRIMLLDENRFKREKTLSFLMILCFSVLYFLIATGFSVFGASDPMVEIVSAILDNVVFRIFKTIGVMLTAYGIGALILSFKNDDPESKSRAIHTLVAGIALLSTPNIIDEINLIKYIK